MELTGRVVQEMLKGSELLDADPETEIIEFPLSILSQLTEGISLQEMLAPQEDVLGYYTPMGSPGTITLHSSRLRAFFWHMVDRLRSRRSLPVAKSDLPSIAHLLATKTYHHEYFHFFCDIQRHLFPSSLYDRLIEEALAVAYAYRMINLERGRWQSKIGRMGSVIYPPLLTGAFCYTSPGYCDWILYADDTRFSEGLCRYIAPPGCGFLESSGVSASTLLMAQLREVYTFGVLHTLL